MQKVKMKVQNDREKIKISAFSIVILIFDL